MTPPSEGFLPTGEYLRLAENTGFFRPPEIEILEEVIFDYQKAPNSHYF